MGQERAMLLAVALMGCGEEPEPVAGCPAPVAGERLVVTADWLNGSLTLFGLERLVDPACTADQAMMGTVDLSAHPPGPLEVEITPDGARAVVASGAGFLPTLGIQGDADVASGGALLVVDLAARSVVHAIDMAAAPMGIAIHPDGRTAFVANYGDAGATARIMSVVDLEAGMVTAEVEVGQAPEQIALSADGSLGLVNAAEDDVVRVFATSDPEGTLSIPLFTGADPSGSAFVGADRVAVAASVGFNLAVVDASDPSMPSLEGSVGVDLPYGVTRVPGATTVLVTTMFGSAELAVVDVAGEPSVAERIALDGGTFPLVAAVDPSGAHAFVPHPNDRRMSIVDLGARTARGIGWLDRPGPTYVAVQP